MKKVAVLILFFIFGAQAFAQPNMYPKHAFPPAPTYNSVLDSFHLYKDGRVKMLGGWGYFFTHQKGVLKVLRNGEYFDEYELLFSPRTVPFYEFDVGTLKSHLTNRTGMYLTQAGNYEFEFYMGGKKFYSFPFELTVTGGDDPYNPNKVYRTEGDWSEYAFLYRNKKMNDWRFYAWFRSPNDAFKKSKFNLEIVRDSDKKVFALYSTILHRERYWNSESFVLRKEAKEANGRVYRKDIKVDEDKFEDGGYTIKTTLDQKPHRTFKFTVKDGEIQYQGRQIRKNTDPLRFIEGGRNQFWMKAVQ